MVDKSNKRARFRSDNGRILEFDPNRYNPVEELSDKEVSRMMRSREGSGEPGPGPFDKKSKRYASGGLIKRGMGAAKRGGKYSLC